MSDLADRWYLTRDQVRAVDAQAMAVCHMPGVLLMENAGRGASEILARLNSNHDPVLIVCGSGNNGGDGLVMARHLENLGLAVQVYLVATPNRRGPRLSDDAAVNYDIAVAGGISITVINPDEAGDWKPAFDALVSSSGWIVDAMFGTGLARPISGVQAEIVDAINQSGKPVFAVDLPSGMDANTGEPLGPTIIAQHTATFVAQKTAFKNPAAMKFTGEIHVVDIGVPKKLLTEIRQSIQSLQVVSG